MFSKLFGRASKSADGFQVQLKIPVSWDNKKKFSTRGTYPHAVLELRPGMSEAEAEGHLRSAGARQSLAEIFWGRSAQAVSMTMDKDRIIRRIYISSLVVDDVTVAGVRLRMPVSMLQTEWPDLAPDEENTRIAKAAPFPLDFTYYKIIRDGVQIEVTAQAGIVHGIGLVTPGWISDTAKAM